MGEFEAGPPLPSKLHKVLLKLGLGLDFEVECSKSCAWLPVKKDGVGYRKSLALWPGGLCFGFASKILQSQWQIVLCAPPLRKTS